MLRILPVIKQAYNPDVCIYHLIKDSCLFG